MDHFCPVAAGLGPTKSQRSPSLMGTHHLEPLDLNMDHFSIPRYLVFFSWGATGPPGSLQFATPSFPSCPSFPTPELPHESIVLQVPETLANHLYIVHVSLAGKLSRKHEWPSWAPSLSSVLSSRSFDPCCSLCLSSWHKEEGVCQHAEVKT